jgi:hypothetical protein
VYALLINLTATDHGRLTTPDVILRAIHADVGEAAILPGSRLRTVVIASHRAGES